VDGSALADECGGGRFEEEDRDVVLLREARVTTVVDDVVVVVGAGADDLVRYCSGVSQSSGFAGSATGWTGLLKRASTAASSRGSAVSQLAKTVFSPAAGLAASISGARSVSRYRRPSGSRSTGVGRPSIRMVDRENVMGSAP
jgi:hypothetical protein